MNIYNINDIEKKLENYNVSDAHTVVCVTVL